MVKSKILNIVAIIALTFTLAACNTTGGGNLNTKFYGKFGSTHGAGSSGGDVDVAKDTSPTYAKPGRIQCCAGESNGSSGGNSGGGSTGGGSGGSSGGNSGGSGGGGSGGGSTGGGNPSPISG